VVLARENLSSPDSSSAAHRRLHFCNRSLLINTFTIPRKCPDWLTFQTRNRIGTKEGSRIANTGDRNCSGVLTRGTDNRIPGTISSGRPTDNILTIRINGGKLQGGVVY
jgi:hypothetical protein